jgi:hypothetical protein
MDITVWIWMIDVKRVRRPLTPVSQIELKFALHDLVILYLFLCRTVPREHTKNTKKKEEEATTILIHAPQNNYYYTTM